MRDPARWPPGRQGALALVAGAVSVLGYAPFYLFPLPLVSLAVLFYLGAHVSRPRQAAWLGFVFGMGFFGAGVSWVYVSLHDFGAMPMPLAIIATILFVGVLSLFTAAAGWLQALISRSTTARAALLGPALWVLAEWCRGWVLTGFPWLAVGYSQVPYSPLAGFAPVLGVYGVSLATALTAGLFAVAWLGVARSGAQGATPGWGAAFARQRGHALIPVVLPVVVVLWGAGWGLKTVAWTEPEGDPVTVSLVQGNIPQDLKWREDRLVSTLETYRKLVQTSPGRLIILPETALPLFYHQLPPHYLALLSQQAVQNGGDIIVGLPEIVSPEAGEASDYFNSAFSFGTEPTQTYRKFHLVPFGEYIPLKPIFGWIINVLHIPLSDFSRGATHQTPMAVAGQHVAVNICYEDVFGEEIIRQLPQATLLANISNDAWFGDSAAPWQHFQISQMRAAETGRVMLRATNTGVTGIIDSKGYTVETAPEFEETVLNGEVQGYRGTTPYITWGNQVALALIAVLIVAGWLAGRRRGGSKTSS